MFKLNNKAKEVFESEKGALIYNEIFDTVKKHNMSDLIDKGVLLGFSGGADSMMLLLFLLEYQRREQKNFTILCVHVNHGIRGEEAKRDQDFSKTAVATSSATYEAREIDIPTLSHAQHIGLEEAARNARYDIFTDIIKSRNDLSAIATAHNATDNVETVILNMLRGSGLNGLCGIKPVRNNIVRPLIKISKREIIELLDCFKVEYVTDSTNLSSEYSRNYVRNEILPLFERISSNTESVVSRMTDNLIEDLNYIEAMADEFLQDNKNSFIPAEELSNLPPALFARVMHKWIIQTNGITPEDKHINAIKHLLVKNNFYYSLPGKCNFACQRGKCFFIDKSAKNPLKTMIFPLETGENILHDTNLVIYIGDQEESYSKIYNFAIQAHISSDIIKNGVFLRVKNDGDAYRYGGITHKLKKIFNDRGIPPVEREYIPIITDCNGILWIPGLPVRDGASSGENLTKITVCYKEKLDGEIEMHTALKRI